MRGESWGKYPKLENQEYRAYDSSIFSEEFSTQQKSELSLPYGLGRSYGDVCLNANGRVLGTRLHDRFIDFNHKTGELTAQAGVSLDNAIKLILPKGWFIPVSPGTQFVTLGGAVGNDIHGKNHHCEGTFGRHVKEFTLRRSNGELLTCSKDKESDLFKATIAGLGLTGVIETVTLSLKRAAGPYIDVETVKFENLDEFFEIANDSDEDFEYTVAWIDCVNGGSSDWQKKGKGHFIRGNHSSKQASSPSAYVASKPLLQVPFNLPSFALNRLTLGAFNTLYYNRQLPKSKKRTEHYRPFFYPLDGILHWNRIYGKRGFLQFQCVVPTVNDNKAIREILDVVYAYGKASFLAVIKKFGDIASPGLLSFPREGVTICLDFPYEGEKTLKLFSALEDKVIAANGALYPAKDACMNAKSFQQFYPQWKKFSEYVDPKFSSSFWRRVNE